MFYTSKFNLFFNSILPKEVIIISLEFGFLCNQSFLIIASRREAPNAPAI